LLTKKQTPGVVFQPQVHRKLQHGIQTFVNALRPTLGPVSGGVAIDHINNTKDLPEFLDDGGTIARRIIELPNRDEDMGAMLLRSMLVKQKESVGDGTVTAAILLEAIFSAGIRYITAGGNAMQVRRQLEKILPIILEEVDRASFKLDSHESLIDMAYTLCHDREIAQAIGEVFDLLGKHGRLEVREGYGRDVEHEYVQGTYYYSGAFSRAFFGNDIHTRIELYNTSIFLCDYTIEDHKDLFPVMKAAHDAGVESLVIIARGLSEKAIGMLTTNNKMDSFTAVGIKLPGSNEADKIAAIEDLTLLTGANPYLKITGGTLEIVKADDFGKVRSIWADLRTFGIVGGRGDKRKLRKHIQRLKDKYPLINDYEDQKRLNKRIGNLLGGSATLWLGGHSETEISAKKNLIERTIQIMRQASEHGVVHGGGMMYLQLTNLLKQHYAEATDTDERAAYRILMEAFSAPVRALYQNAGYDPGDILAQIQHAGTLSAFDVETGQCVQLCEFGIYDSTEILKATIRNAISTAALMLTIDCFVHRSNPELVGDPR
jgi:chaperonin GroEL